MDRFLHNSDELWSLLAETLITPHYDRMTYVLSAANPFQTRNGCKVVHIQEFTTTEQSNI